MGLALPTYLGYVAGTLTTIAFLLQLLKIWRTKSAEDVSLAMFLIFTCGVFLWLVYGLMIGAWPVVIANAITFLLALAILCLKLWYRPSVYRGGRQEPSS